MKLNWNFEMDINFSGMPLYLPPVLLCGPCKNCVLEFPNPETKGRLGLVRDYGIISGDGWKFHQCISEFLRSQLNRKYYF